MSEKITLQNFENLLNPDALDKGRALFEAKKLGKVKEIEPFYWDATLEGEEVGVLLDKKGSVLEAACTCADFRETDWADNSCAHVTALLFALNLKYGAAARKADKSDKTKAVKNKKSAAPKKPLDPGEALLATLEAKDIYEFVRQTLAKDKAFKSQFLMHFSEKNEGNAQKFEEIVTNAIQAIRGRRKYLQGADGAKITTALTPLYKQAAAAEAKGHSREAFAICQALMREIPKVLASMESHSARLNTLFANTLEVVSLVVENSKTPFELRQEIFETLLRNWHQAMMNSGDATYHDHYAQLLGVARAVKRLDDVAVALRQLVEHYHNLTKASRWYSGEVQFKNAMVTRLFELYSNDLKALDKAEALLLQHKDQLVCYLKLVALKKEAKDFETALKYLLDIRKNLRKFQDAGAISFSDAERSIDRELLDIYIQSGRHKEAAQTAANLFQSSYYRDFGYYTLEKKCYEPRQWPDRVDQYLSILSKYLRSPYATEVESYVQILLLEERWETLKSFVFKQTNLKYWVASSSYLKDRYPEEYLKAAPQAILKALEQTSQYAYEATAEIMQALTTVPGGPAVVRQLLAQLRQQYPNRRNLMDALNSVKGI